MTELALWLQWGLLAGNVVLALAACIVGGRRPAARPWAFAVGVLAVAHAAYYALFLIWPEVLAAAGTMLFSIALRYMVTFLGGFLLVLAVWRRPWKR